LTAGQMSAILLWDAGGFAINMWVGHLMAIELQHLIDQINKETIESGTKEAERIVSQAQDRAAALVNEAEAAARARLARAEKDAEVYVERSRRTLEQAARDLLIGVGQAIENIIQDIVSVSTDEALDPDTLKLMMVKMAEAYAAKNGTESRIEFIIGERDQAEIVNFFADQYRRHLVSGVDINIDHGVRKGFRVTLENERVYHDFTKPAIAEALASFVRPQLAEIVHRAARAASSGDKT
jgi:V/A-type H+-transporting ATPase subunit E